jgi:hypothetical protein
VRPVLVVVTYVLAHQTLQMPFVYYDDMIQQVPAAVADEAVKGGAKLGQWGGVKVGQ